MRRTSDSGLKWMLKNYLGDVDFHQFGVVAQQVLAARARREKGFETEENLDDQADAFLRNAGYGGLAKKELR